MTENTIKHYSSIITDFDESIDDNILMFFRAMQNKYDLVRCSPIFRERRFKIMLNYEFTYRNMVLSQILRGEDFFILIFVMEENKKEIDEVLLDGSPEEWIYERIHSYCL